jgi:predicted DNA-binding transcriptional regulator AlpA
MPANPPCPPPDTTPRILRRAEVANRLSLSLRTVDKLPIKKIKLPGRTRAAGFLESDINALLEQKVA